MLEVRNIRKTFGERIALQKVSFEVHPGEIFGLLGPNGAGKTTLLSILCGLLTPDDGEVRIEGKRFLPTHLDLKRRLGLAPQELALYQELTARENLRFLGELYGLRDPLLRDRVDQILSAIGLEDRADQRTSTFSGGMQRRLNLGAALVHQPSILLLDEPTTGVDPQSRNHIFEEVRRLQGQGLTILYTSHYMEEVQALCGRVGIIDHGKLIACDTVERLLRQLPGQIRFRVASLPSAVRDKILSGNVAAFRETDRGYELETRTVSSTLVQVIGIFQEEKIELLHLETEEPNLERVFLHLTGRALRD